MDIQDERERTIVTTRVLNAPRATVFRAWTDPAILAQWWGPKGFTNTFHTFEPRPGGTWDFHMHGPDGTSYHNVSVFQEVVPDERIVFDHVKPMHPFIARITFSDHPEGTLIDWRMVHPTVEECERMQAFVPQANKENLDRLNARIHELH